MSKSINPHDAITKTFLSDLTVAKDFLTSHLPEALKSRIDFKTLQLEPTSFVEEDLKQYTTDILYSVNIDEKEGFVYCLVEAQSTPDRLMPFRFWHYQTLILKHYLKNRDNQEALLPMVIPLLLYTGKQSPYPYSLKLTDCFTDTELAEEKLYEPPHLIDLSQMSDDEIKQHGQVALLEMVQKHIHDRDLMNFAHEFVLLLNQVMPVKSLYIPLLKYIIVAGDSNNYNGFLEVVKEQSHSEYRGDTMTIAQRLENEGFEKGVRKVAFEMLADGVEFRFVEKYTGISEKQLRDLQR